MKIKFTAQEFEEINVKETFDYLQTGWVPGLYIANAFNKAVNNQYFCPENNTRQLRNLLENCLFPGSDKVFNEGAGICDIPKKYDHNRKIIEKFFNHDYKQILPSIR